MIELDFDINQPSVEAVAAHLGEGRVWVVSRPTKHFGFALPRTKVKHLIKKKLWPAE